MSIDKIDGIKKGWIDSLHVEIATPASPPGQAAGQTNLRSLKLDLPQRLPARLQTIQRACPREREAVHAPAADDVHRDRRAERRAYQTEGDGGGARVPAQAAGAQAAPPRQEAPERVT